MPSVDVYDIPVSGTITTQNLVPAGAATTGSAVEITPDGRGSVTVQVTGTYTGALSAQATVNGTAWVTIGGLPFTDINTGTNSATIASGGQGVYRLGCQGFARVRVTALSAVTGSAAISMRATDDAAGILDIEGNVASSAADAGNPVKIGGVNRTTQPTLTDGQRGDAQLDTRGNLIVTINGKGGSAGANVLNAGTDATTFTNALGTWSQGVVFNGSTYDRARGDTNGAVTQPALSSTFWGYAGATGGITNTTDVAVRAAAGAGVRNYITGIQFKNTSATASEIVIKDGATIVWRGHVSASMTVSDGFTFNPPLRGTANTAVNVALITTGTATLVDVQGYTGA